MAMVMDDTEFNNIVLLDHALDVFNTTVPVGI